MSSIPVTFDGRFGWFHPAPGGRGVVLCSAMGHEELSAHRAWRGLAQRFAAMGMPALRFDYHGTGDSLGDDEQPGRLRAWSDSVLQAVRWMREEAGVGEIALVGMRLGATLAARAACELGGVNALALLAPAVSGRAYVRELKALARMAPPLPGAPPASPDRAADLEVGGFVVTAETLADLGKLDLLDLGSRPAPRILILKRADPSEAPLAQRLRDLDATVQEAPFSDYSSLMRDVNFASPPDEAFNLVLDWMVADVTAHRSRTGRRRQPVRLSMPDAVEEPVFFGDKARLFGIVCRPRRPGADLPPVVFVNTGANHHIGSNRMTVVLARRLARLGVTSLRMDVAGIGESPAAPGQPDNRLYSEDACEDVRAALDWLGGQKLGPAVAVGLCCGGYVAFYTALRDARLVGLVMANVQRFVWREGDSLEINLRRSYQSNRYYVAMARRSDTWRRALRGEVNARGILTAVLGRVRKRILMRVDDWQSRLFGRGGARQRVVRGFRGLSARGAETLLIYSAADGGLDELEAYFGRGGRRLSRLPRMQIDIVDGADHTFTARWARERFAERVEAHLHRVREARRHHPAAARPAEAGSRPAAELGRRSAPTRTA